MDSGYSGSSSATLPGAWSSSWTLSDGGAGDWTEQPPNSPKRHWENKSLQDEENKCPAFHGISSSKGLYSADTNICDDANSHSSLSDEESVLSDDFYSFISQEVDLWSISHTMRCSLGLFRTPISLFLRAWYVYFGRAYSSSFILISPCRQLHVNTPTALKKICAPTPLQNQTLTSLA